MSGSTPATTWGIGEYALMAERLEPAAEAIVELAQVTERDRVLDVACGTGNAALLAAARGAAVTALDFEPALLDITRARGAALDLELAIVQADLERLPPHPERFDVILSAFGVMYAPGHDAAAAALARSSNPGARIALANWTPGSFMPVMGATVAPYLPPPPAGGEPPSRWGDPDYVAELLTRHGIELLATETRSLQLDFPSVDAAADFLILTAGHVLAERARLEGEGRWGALHDDLRGLVATGGERSSIECEYLLVRAERRPD